MCTEGMLEMDGAAVAERFEGGLKVLVVEDDDGLRRAIREVFLMRGFAVNTARDGADAVGLAQQERYDVVVSDIRLPGIDGIAVTRRVTRLEDAPRVVLMTAYPSWKVYEEAREAGAERVINKPVSLGKLASLVENLAGGGVVEGKGD